MQRRRHLLSLLIAVMASTVLATTPAAGPVEAIDNNAALARVASIHGAAGPFAVIGYRIGVRALAMLDAPYGSFDLDVIHRTPLEVQYSCVADGVQAATGVSVGKLNLRLEKSTLAQMETVVRDKATGKEVVFHLKPEVISRFLNLPHDQLERAGREVMDLPDDQLFWVAMHE